MVHGDYSISNTLFRDGELVRSEYGVRQHYCGPLERQADLDRFWFQRCEAADTILDNIDELSARFASVWEHHSPLARLGENC